MRTVTQLRDQTARADVALNHNHSSIAVVQWPRCGETARGGREQEGRYRARLLQELSHFSLNQFTVSNFTPGVAPNRDVPPGSISGTAAAVRGTTIVVVVVVGVANRLSPFSPQYFDVSYRTLRGTLVSESPYLEREVIGPQLNRTG